jgi:hypothetical protein
MVININKHKYGYTTISMIRIKYGLSLILPCLFPISLWSSKRIQFCTTLRQLVDCRSNIEIPLPFHGQDQFVVPDVHVD